MKILLANDDGIGAEGILLLEKIVKNISDEYKVVAPASHKSGAGHAITITDALILKEFDKKHYAVNGSPADCVTMAFSQLYKDETQPELVISGINYDRNYGSDVTSSGTVAVCIESLIQGAKAIALSQRMSDAYQGFQVAEKYANKVLEKIIPMLSKLPKNVLVNVNFPACSPDDVLGIKIAKQAIYNQPRTVKGPFSCPFGFDYYWQSDAVMDTNYPTDSDIYLSHQNYITVTPLKIDLTDYDALKILEEIKW